MKEQLNVFAFDIPVTDDIQTKPFVIQGEISEKTTASLYQRQEMNIMIDVIRVNVVVEENTNGIRKKCELEITQNTPKHPSSLTICDALWYGYIVARKKQELIEFKLMEFNVYIRET